MPLAPFGSLDAFLHHGAANASGVETLATRDRGGGVLRRAGLARSSSISNGLPGGGGAGAAGGGDDGNEGRRPRRPHLSAALKAAMAFDVARGMLHLHENGFLHGALKPKNVLVCGAGLGGRRGGGGCLVVLLGVAA